MSFVDGIRSVGNVFTNRPLYDTPYADVFVARSTTLATVPYGAHTLGLFDNSELSMAVPAPEFTDTASYNRLVAVGHAAVQPLVRLRNLRLTGYLSLR